MPEQERYVTEPGNGEGKFGGGRLDVVDTEEKEHGDNYCGGSQRRQDVGTRMPYKKKREECSGSSHHHTRKLPAGERHSVKLLEAEGGTDHDQAGKL